jgi:N-acetylglutamate synthase-like GNAT family acetyltransferase
MPTLIAPRPFTIRAATIADLPAVVSLLTSAGQQMISVEARRFVALREVRDELDKLVKATSGNTAAMRLLSRLGYLDYATIDKSWRMERPA